MIWCKTMMVSWALVFSEPHDLDGLEKTAAFCFHAEDACQQAALGAEAALYFAGYGASVACVRQPQDKAPKKIGE